MSYTLVQKSEGLKTMVERNSFQKNSLALLDVSMLVIWWFLATHPKTCFLFCKLGKLCGGGVEKKNMFEAPPSGMVT